MTIALLERLLEISARAAVVVREVYDAPFSVEWKGPRDPVTAADRRANELICRELAAAFPGVPVVAEESDPESFAAYRESERVFFVDPLDGTAEFIDRNGEFVVMIGLVDGDRAVAGVVVAPASGRSWAGGPGLGAFRVAPDGSRTAIRVSPGATLGTSRAVASRSHRSPALERVLAELRCASVVALGSAGLKGAAIAEGDAEIYVGPGMAGKRWDVCAVEAIVTGAGGRYTDARGLAFDYRAPSLTNEHGILATNGLLHDAVLDGLTRAGLR